MQLSVASRQSALESLYPTWVPKTLHQALIDAATRWPTRPLVFSGDIRLTYRDVVEQAEILASGFVAAGVRPGDHVALLLANIPEFVPIKFALSMVGASTVPVNYLNREQELAYVLQQSDTHFLITMDRFRDLDYLAMLDAIIPGWPASAGGQSMPKLSRVFVVPTGQRGLPPNVATLETLRQLGDQAAIPVEDANAVSDIIYTSGTTGGPKGVLLTHDMLLRAAFGSAYARGFIDGQRIQFALPMYHVYGYVEGLLAALMVGGAIVIHRQFEPKAFLASIAHYDVNDLLLVPTMTLALLDAAESSDYDVSSVRSVLSSGGKAPPEIWNRLYAVFGEIEITTGYGMSEATASTTVTRPDDPLNRLLTTNGRLRDVGVAGEPDPNRRLVNYRVVDPVSGELLPPGAVGELRMKGIGVTAGYYNKPLETAAAFDDDGWFCTGDLGAIDEEGYLVLKGRTKESYRCGGELVLPLEVEQVLGGHPAVDEVHVVAIPDERMGEVGVACVVTPAPDELDAAALINYAAARLARFKVPRYVVFVQPEDIPVTATGRPRKFLLTEVALERLRREGVAQS